MKNIFIITLGTREVQLQTSKLTGHGFVISSDEKEITHPDLPGMKLAVYKNQNFPDYFCCDKPRVSGETILENWDNLKKVIEFPLIGQAWDTIITGNTIHELILIYTDQKDIDTTNKKSLGHFNCDTIFYRDIVRRQLHEQHPDLPNNPESDIAVTEKTADIDFQYRNFAVTCKALYEQEPEIQQVFLLAQGGIDQINHALTLQLIQAFGSKVQLWQQPENSLPKPLVFPFLFIQDLNKQKIQKHLEDYDFGLIANLSHIKKNEIVECAEFAFRKLNLDYSYYSPSVQQFIQDDTPEIRCKDLYINAKINFLKGDYGNYLWRLFTLMENIYRFKCEKIIGATEHFYKPSCVVNQEWENKLNEIPGLLSYLKKPKTGKNKRGNLLLDNPNRNTFKEIYTFVCNNKMLSDNTEYQSKMNFVYNLSLNLLKHRNALAHYLKPISKEIIETSLGGRKCLELNDALDYIFHFEPEKPFEVFDDIKIAIYNYL